MEHFRVEEISEGVHAAIATPDGYGLCNAGIVDLGGTTLVFDAMLTPEAGEALGRAAVRLTGRPVGLLVDSHYHGDHVRGNGSVGATHIVSTHRVRELILERASEHLRSDRAEAPQELERMRGGASGLADGERVVREAWMRGILATPPNLVVRPPDVTFADELVIRGARRTARVLSYGGGHSPSDVLVYLPDEKIVLLGDLLAVGFHPSMSDGNLASLVRILEQVEALPTDRALPGHGPVGTARSVHEMSRYVGAVRQQAIDAHRSGLSREHLATISPEAAFRGWGFSEFFRSNLEFAYDALGATRPAAVPSA